jgi:endonuclease/exonuclease/phosphatase family metal-dependent hydrolase
MRVRLLTINLLNDLSRWERRRTLLLQGLQALQPDLIGLQEVRLPENYAAWLRDHLPGYTLHLAPKTGASRQAEGIAILSRLPVSSHTVIELDGQGRVAQRVLAQAGGGEFAFANGHYFWQPGESAGRERQVEQVIKWMEGLPPGTPQVVGGDFNGEPHTRAIRRMSEIYRSAYAAFHGREPDFTCPTPLPRAPGALLRTLLGFVRYLRLKDLRPGWRGVLDYMFVTPEWRVMDCRVVFDQPAPDDPRLYASDHFGIYAELELNGVS